MSDAREIVLGRIRHALAAGPPAPADEMPGFRREGRGDAGALVTTFADRAGAYKVRVERAPRAEAAAMAARLLGERGHVRLIVPDGVPADLLPEGFDLVPDERLGNDAVAAADGVVTTCACAIAQTGTIVLDHGPGQGRRVLTLLPDYHLCLVEAGCLVDLVPEAVERVAPAVRAGRPLTFVSGPSATSDIELSRVEGVHGPRTLDVIVVE